MNRILVLVFSLFLSMMSVPAYEEDNFVNDTLKSYSIPQTNLNYEYTDTQNLPIRLNVIDKIRTEKDLYEGQIINLKVSKDVIYKNKVVIKKGTIVPARVETIITNGMNGIPASIILGNFQIPNIKFSQLTANYEKFGRDWSLMVYPLKWALTILPPTGSFTNFIRGGHAKISQKEDIIIYYHPNWI